MKELNLLHNNISDINVLEKVKFEKLEILILDWNQITDIKVLSNIKLKNLKGLYLYGNPIDENSSIPNYLESIIEYKIDN